MPKIEKYIFPLCSKPDQCLDSNGNIISTSQALKAVKDYTYEQFKQELIRRQNLHNNKKQMVDTEQDKQMVV